MSTTSSCTVSVLALTHLARCISCLLIALILRQHHDIQSTHLTQYKDAEKELIDVINQLTPYSSVVMLKLQLLCIFPTENTSYTKTSV